MNRRISALVFFLFALGGWGWSQTSEAPLPVTVAERTQYQETSRHQDVLDFCAALAKSSRVRLADLGTSGEGRKLPLLIIAEPPVSRPEEVKDGKLVVFLQGNIHAGEVDGKEALLMLARDLAQGDGKLLKDLVVLIAPNVNPDGNEKLSKGNRQHQKGPAEVGIRENAAGYDLNRDFVKLETPEVRALARVYRRWDPAVVVDMHTTNGSYHRYTLTYDGPRHPACADQLVKTVQESMLPDLGRRLEQKTGYKSINYGNFSGDRTKWLTYPATPRYGTQYVGIRGRIAILSESYVYAPFKDRIAAGREFARAILEYAAQEREKLGPLLKGARAPAERVPLQFQAKPTDRPLTILGYEEKTENGRRTRTDQPKDYPVQFLAACEPTRFVQRPAAYLIPASEAKAVENLLRHGIEVQELREDIELDVEVYRIDQVTREERAFQKHATVQVAATPRRESRRVLAGTYLVKTAQPLGMLAAYLLEPQSEDGLCTWNFFDPHLAEGKDYPVVRLPELVPITAGRVRPLAEDRPAPRMLTYESVYGSGGETPNFRGDPVAGLRWLDEGEHFVQVKEGKAYRVHAATGRMQPYEAKEGEGAPVRGRRGGGIPLPQDPAGQPDPQRKELVARSPDGQYESFVRGNNLFVTHLETQKEIQLTTDGSELVSNGKNDWVYFEEVFNRSWNAHWWSPDSKHIVFLRIDDAPVKKFTVVDHIPTRLKVENTPYPKAGDPNPFVKVGVADVATGSVAWCDLGDYPEDNRIVLRTQFTPDGKQAYVYVSDRIQSWLDFLIVPTSGGKPKRLFRDATKAWVDDPGEPRFLQDGSFLFFSERTGWKHLYHYDREGKLLAAVTRGDFEVRGIVGVDEENRTVYFTATRDNPIGLNLYRVKLDGGSLERLTSGPGDHRVSLSPKFQYFIDSTSSQATPTRVYLHAADGRLVRTLDTNPVYALEDYRLGKSERVQIPMPDGFLLEGTILLPPDFDPSRKYPVWFMTYAGPHAPTVSDSFGDGRIRDQTLAQMGFVIFRTDPRSASGKGAQSTWTAYKQLGIQELKDIEAAIQWLCKNPWVDPARIGMSGHSYGGFMTAFALTHSKLFACGIAGAPVTDWHNYDTIYTERYMSTPQDNPKGYEITSVVKAAKNLHGRLLLIHGLMDDNVHVQNTIQLMQELQAANKEFDVMFYPRARHGIFGRHYERLMLEFMKRHLKPGT